MIEVVLLMCVLLMSLVFGMIYKQLAVNRLLNENKELTKRLARLQLRFDLAVQGSNAGIYEWDIKSNAITHNAIVDQMLGFQPNELVDLSLDGFIERLHPDDRERVGVAVQEHLSRKLPYEIEFRMRRKDGSYIWVADSGMAMRDEYDRPVLWAGTMLNITTRKAHEAEILKSNEELRNANREIDLLVYRITHDLKAPLNSILALTDIGMVSSDDAERRFCWDSITERTRHLSSYIMDLIESIKISKLEVQSTPTNLHDLVNDVIKLVKVDDCVEIKNRVPKNHVIKSDSSRLSTIFNNLISNSIKYRDPNKQQNFIDITSNVLDDKYEVLIEDNGIGVEPKHLSRIFEMFYRATDRVKGSGLGLYIVKEAISKLGGEVEIKSAISQGTQVRLLI